MGVMAYAACFFIFLFCPVVFWLQFLCWGTPLRVSCCIDCYVLTLVCFLPLVRLQLYFFLSHTNGTRLLQLLFCFGAPLFFLGPISLQNDTRLGVTVLFWLQFVLLFLLLFFAESHTRWSWMYSWILKTVIAARYVQLTLLSFFSSFPYVFCFVF